MSQTIPRILRDQAQLLKRRTAEKYPDLAPLAEQCFLNTIETTVTTLEDGSSFVITGDIPAMWLRDSAAQLKPYIQFANEDAELKAILRSVVQKHAFYINHDPYANAFNALPEQFHQSDETDFKSGWVWERKYEVDSLCAALYLSHEYYSVTKDDSIFTEDFRLMLTKIVGTFSIEQRHNELSSYFFTRQNCARTDTLPNHGWGHVVNYTGMTWSGFRPSDDACTFGYLIPANMMAVVALRYGAELARAGFDDESLASACLLLAEEIDDGIRTYGIVNHPKYGRIYAYETDGYGNYVLMDDANSPSLLSIPYLGYVGADDPVYQNTRRFILSPDNPYYFSGQYAKGIGSPHTPDRYIWHIALTMQILTSTDPAEVNECLGMLAATHAGTNYMHEGFCVDDPTQYTRPWFAWANTLFAQMLGEVTK